eukprot:4495023-Amphidinium_carterae.1
MDMQEALLQTYSQDLVAAAPEAEAGDAVPEARDAVLEPAMLAPEAGDAVLEPEAGPEAGDAVLEFQAGDAEASEDELPLIQLLPEEDRPLDVALGLNIGEWGRVLSAPQGCRWKSDNYRLMYYKKHQLLAVRARFGTKLRCQTP